MKTCLICGKQISGNGKLCGKNCRRKHAADYMRTRKIKRMESIISGYTPDENSRVNKNAKGGMFEVVRDDSGDFSIGARLIGFVETVGMGNAPDGMMVTHHGIKYVVNGKKLELVK